MRTVDFERVMADDGLIASDASPLPFGTEGRPWYLSLVLGAAGWLASFFMLGFVVVLFEPDTPAAAAVLGVIMLGAGFGLYRADRESAFFEQLALALSLAGQLALMFAVGEATESELAVAIFTTFQSVALVWLLPNRFAKFLSTVFACLAWAFVVRLGWWGEDLFGQERLAVSLGPALVGWCVIWVPVGAALHQLIEREAQWMASDARLTVRPMLTGFMLALSFGTWFSEPFAALPFRAPPGTVPTNWLTLWPLLAVAAALFSGLCAFRLRHRPMIGVAIAGALLHVVHFYYLLGVSLVMKSWIMLGLGGVLLLAARAVSMRVEAASSAGGGIT